MSISSELGRGGSGRPGRLAALVTALEDAGTEVALVDMPVTDEYVERHPDGEADYDEYLQALRALARRTGADVFEFDTMRDPDQFADIVHLDEAGAAEFTADLATALRDAGLFDGLGK